MERAPGNHERIVQKGSLVKLREDIRPEVEQALAGTFEKGNAYRVLHVSEGPSPIVWLSLTELSPRDVEEFEPSLSREERYAKNVLPLELAHVTPLTN